MKYFYHIAYKAGHHVVNSDTGEFVSGPFVYYREAEEEARILQARAESTREHQKQDHSILLSGAGQTKDAERVGGHHRI
jgi:hypothetical protein